MSAPFNSLRHGSLDRLVDDYLENYPMDEQELRAVLQNVIEEVIRIREKVDGGK